MLFLGMISEDTFTYLLYAWIALAFIVFPILLRITAPYGRHTTNTWGPTINNRLGWVLMELPVIIVFSYFLFRNGNQLSYPVLVFYALSLFQQGIYFPLQDKNKWKTNSHKYKFIGFIFQYFQWLFQWLLVVGK